MPHSVSSSTSARVIGPLGGFAIVAGSMIGIGVFLSPSIVAEHLRSPAAFFTIWALGGLTALAGAVACAELGTMMPEAGGDYVFQHAAFGPSAAFASGCVLFAAIFSGSIATMAVGVSKYQLATLTGIDMTGVALRPPFGPEISGAQLSASLLIMLLTAVNARGALVSSGTQVALTITPIAILALGAAYALTAMPSVVSHSVPTPDWTVGGGVLAYMAVYFAYSGWINVIYVAGEMKSPERSIPWSLVSGTLAVTLLYLLLCAGFVHLLGMEGVRQAGESGSAAAALLAGDAGRTTIAFLIAAALLASVNGTILASARVAYAMSLKGAIPRWLGHLSGRGVPDRALWVQALVSVALVVTGRFEELYSMVSLAMVVTGTLTVCSLFVLRRTRPDARRPYRATGYPWLPALYVLSSLLVLTVTVGQALSGEPNAWYPLLGLGILVAAYSVHRGLIVRSSSRG